MNVQQELPAEHLSCHVCEAQQQDLQCNRCNLGVCYDCARPCRYCGWEYDHMCEVIHMLTCPERRYEPSEPNLTTYMASKDEEETPCMEGVTEFHFIGADEVVIQQLSFSIQ
eukprot:3375241-Karenia_brevis.AAC.1